MVTMLRCLVTERLIRPRRVAGQCALVLLVFFGGALSALAQEPNVHYLHQGIMPPGAIGSRQLLRGGPVPGFFQPAQITAPAGVAISMATGGNFEPSAAAPAKVGLLIGSVYRFRVTNIPLNPGLEVFPTIELVDRIYAPEGQEVNFPIPVELTQDDLELALAGKFVTRVIYLENPRSAAPIHATPEKQSWFDIGPNRDPLAVADGLGRPVAILRLGGRVPAQTDQLTADFLFGSPPWMKYPAATAPATPAQPQAAPAAPAPAAPPAGAQRL